MKLGLIAVTAVLLFSSPPLAAGEFVRLANHVPEAKIATARAIDRMPSDSRLSLAISLNPPDRAGLQTFIQRLYDSSDPMHGHFLTPRQFADQFGPSQSDYDQVARYLSGLGLEVVRTHANRLVIDVEASVGAIESAFQTEIHRFQTADGRLVHAATINPAVDARIAPKIAGIDGLNSFTIWKPHFVTRAPQPDTLFGTGPLDALAPADIKTAYGYGTATATGSGQSVALFELDGYTASDITAYETQFSITAPPTLTNVLVDGATGTPSAAPSGQPASDGQIEVSLDIEMLLALAPGASKIYVYEGPLTDAGVIDTYSQIASDDLAPQVSTSWGSAEDLTLSTIYGDESTIFMEMAAQGQNLFAAAGDTGAYADDSTVSVQDPCSQLYVVCVGGTKITLNSTQGYQSETTWSDPLALEGGGGGISTLWDIPSWQTGLGSATNLGSSAMRMVPDVSLNADPFTGYAVRAGTTWMIIGGTSAAAPLWGAFLALVNQERAAGGLGPLGYANPGLYQLGQSGLYSQLFHDIADDSSNLHYPAVTGYDLATGWGSFIIQPLIQALSKSTLPPFAPTHLSVVNITP